MTEQTEKTSMHRKFKLTYTPSRKLGEREVRKIEESFESQIDLLHKGQGNIHTIMVVLDQSFGANAPESHQLVLTLRIDKDESSDNIIVDLTPQA